MNKKAASLTEKVEWNLDDIFKNGEEENLFKAVYEKVSDFKNELSDISPDMDAGKFFRLVGLTEEINEIVSRLYSRGGLMEAVDQTSPEARVLKSRAKDIQLEAESALRSFFHWIKGKKVNGRERLDSDSAARLFSLSPEYKYSFNYMRKLASYTLSDSEEEIISNKDANGIENLKDLRTMIETEFEFEFKPLGKKVKKINSQPELFSYTRSSSPSERKAAYEALLEEYRKKINIFYSVYSSVVKDWVFEAALRGYPSSVSMRNTANHISDDTVKVLLETCRSNRDVFQDYFRYKASQLGVEKLSRYDLYAPVGKEDKRISYRDSLDIVLDVLGSLSGEFRKKAEKIVTSGHIDSHPSPSKVPGAFCWTVSPEVTPYILLNHASVERDTLTLAHEMGHGIHSLYASNLPYSLQHAVLPLAETASTFCEMAVFEKLLRSLDGESKKRLLANKLAESYATILRQSYFVEFELKIHDRIKEGPGPGEISDIYFSTLQEQFGDSVDVSSIFRYEWAYVPHIVKTPFYCYAYNFGELLTLSLFAKYKSEGPGFIPKIEKILSAGGSRNPAIILGDIGVDINSREFWSSGFEMIRGWLKELQKIN